jgi:hypothetical protein
MIKKLSLLLMYLALSACTTTGHFKVPEGSQLYIFERPQPVDIKANGEVTTKPFFWTAAGIPPGGGVPYRVKKNGETLKEGRLRAKFRVVSLFWPPFAAIYWPMGLNPDITYDLINDKQE